MARPIRIEFDGALYHVTSHGNCQNDIYVDHADRRAFLTVLQNVTNTYNWICHAYCLMNNHYHLLIETPEGNLSKGMRQLNGVYTQTYNRTHQRVGHVFQGRYKAILVEKDQYLIKLSRYIVLNPVRAGMVRHPKDWPWSSYRATVGQSKGLDCLETKWVLGAFGKRKSSTIEKYKAFVKAGKGQPSPWGFIRNQVFLGSEEFVETMQAYTDDDKDLSEIPSIQRRPPPQPLDAYEASCKDRNTAIVQAYQSGGYTLKQIGNYFGLHYSSVSGIIKNHK